MAEVVSLHREEPKGLVVREVTGNVLRLTLNNPPANVLSIALLETLIAELDAVALSTEIRVVILASTGELFSSGHDLKELTSHRTDDDQGRAFFERSLGLCTDLMLRINRLPQPVIAEIDGLATAAGCQLVATCDLAICTDSSTFCTPGVNIGLFCATPSVAVSRAAHPKQAMEMLLTGETIDASTAKDFGLINRIVPKQYLQQVVNKYAAVIATKSPQALKIGKAAFYAQAQMTVEDAYAFTSVVMVENLLERDAKEGIAAVLDKRMPEWKDG